MCMVMVFRIVANFMEFNCFLSTLCALKFLKLFTILNSHYSL